MGYLILASIVWAFSYSLIKANLTTLDPNLVSFCRMAFALPLFLPFLKIKKISWPQGLTLSAIGAIQYGLMYLSFIRSFQYLEAHQIVLFTIFTPLYVVIINSFFDKKSITPYLLFSFLAILGGAIVYYQYAENPNLFTGFLYVQIADLCFAYGQVSYKRFRKKYETLQDKEVYALLFAGALITTGLSTTYNSAWNDLFNITPRQLWVLAYLGIIASGICFFWWNKGAVRVNTGTLAVFNNIKAPLGFIVSFLFFHEQTNTLRLFGGFVLILFALFLSEIYSKRMRNASNDRS